MIWHAMRGSPRQEGKELIDSCAWKRLFALLAVLLLGSGCVSIAEFRQLEDDVWKLQKQGGGGSPRDAQQIADLTLQIDRLRGELAVLQGRVEVAEHQSENALQEAKAARLGNAQGASSSRLSPSSEGANPPGNAVVPTPLGTPDAAPDAQGGAQAGIAQEVQDYRRAYAAWREGEPQVCIDRFREFLQNHPSSSYRDDAKYWIADCYFKQGDYKTAILRFDDVVAQNAGGKKAADALYRQGEALLRLGPAYNKAAEKAFERVVKEYPDSARAPDAKRQLELLSAG